MRYWGAMQSKWGFSDGDAVPDSIEAYRDVYLRVVNRLAEQLGSAVRATAYDRPGPHPRRGRLPARDRHHRPILRLVPGRATARYGRRRAMSGLTRTIRRGGLLRQLGRALRDFGYKVLRSFAEDVFL